MSSQIQPDGRTVLIHGVLLPSFSSFRCTFFLFYYPVEKKKKKEDAWLHFDWISSSSLLFFYILGFDTLYTLARLFPFLFLQVGLFFPFSRSSGHAVAARDFHPPFHISSSF